MIYNYLVNQHKQLRTTKDRSSTVGSLPKAKANSITFARYSINIYFLYGVCSRLRRVRASSVASRRLDSPMTRDSPRSMTRDSPRSSPCWFPSHPRKPGRKPPLSEQEIMCEQTGHVN
eukprot:scaffold99078_cov75-Phaeocystis_antarctica.AAC.1